MVNKCGKKIFGRPEMLTIDGSQKSGSGTILRLSIALAGILGEPLHIYNIRHRRRQPGLRPQHLESVLTAAKLCNAETKEVKLGSRELWFKPNEIVSGEVRAEIGTAGSISMLLLTVLPICAYAKREVTVHVVNGGTDVRYAPTINYLKHVLLPVLEKMGLKASLTVKRFGYYPKGMGEVILNVSNGSKLNSITLEEFGEIEDIQGVSVCTFLEKQRVAERQAEAAKKALRNHNYNADIHVVNDRSNPLQKGSSMVLWAKTSKGALIGGDALGERGKPSEAVGREAAENLLKEIEAHASVDVHLADVLVPYIALADAASTYLTRKITDHLDTNIWLIQKILGVKFQIDKVGGIYRIKKI
jgi:RNA 3'-terminal phosphate cyclase (ATP)